MMRPILFLLAVPTAGLVVCLVISTVEVGCEALMGGLRRVAEDRRNHPTAVGRREARRTRRVASETKRAIERIERLAGR